MTDETAQLEKRFPTSSREIPEARLTEGRYRVLFARTPSELDEIQALRFQVFNLELGEGLASSFETGRDVDAFDGVCHHLLVREIGSGRAVGCYRMQTAAMAGANLGYYSESLFDLQTLPESVLVRAMEVGRACVARSHRNTQVLFLLWKGLALYVAHNHARYLFGCCSLTSQDPREGWAVLRFLERHGHMSTELIVRPHSHTSLPPAEPSSGEVDAVRLPILFKTYLRYGSKVCGPPAIDREFKTIDYLVVLDIDALSSRTHRTFFG
jgi:putative hemolysin